MIPKGHKYALLALPGFRPRIRPQKTFSLGQGLLVGSELPFGMPKYWQDWLGSLRIDELKKANFFITVCSPSSSPDGLDGENQELTTQLERLHFSLLIAAPFVSHGKGALISGGRGEGEVGVSQLSDVTRVYCTIGCTGTPTVNSVLSLAQQISDGILALRRSGEHLRIWRLTRAYYAALKSEELGTRIHQCVRCIEGLIFPRIGDTKRDFRNRCELFVGTGHTKLLGDLFDVRSAVEHLHGPERSIQSRSQKGAALALAKMCFKAESISRYCLHRFFTTASLWPHFKDDRTLESFWKLVPSERRSIWGQHLNLAAALRSFDSKLAAKGL